MRKVNEISPASWLKFQFGDMFYSQHYIKLVFLIFDTVFVVQHKFKHFLIFLFFILFSIQKLQRLQKKLILFISVFLIPELHTFNFYIYQFGFAQNYLSYIRDLPNSSNYIRAMVQSCLSISWFLPFFSTLIPR
jgi:hypothetical protein